MATKQFGKLKLHWSKRGVAYKWGDGEIHRLSFEPKRAGDGSQGDGYEANYGSQGDGGSGYDAQQGAHYGDQPYEAGRYGGALYSNDWLMYALLVLLPPLGIWILWKRERFTPLIRGIVSAVSGIWFVILLIWLFSALLGGGSDSTNKPDPAQLPKPVTAVVPVATTPATGLDTPIAPAPSSAASAPLGNSAKKPADTTDTTGNTQGVMEVDASGTSYCWSSNTDQYYHAKSDCPSMQGTPARVSLQLAKQRDQSACPTCLAGSDAQGDTAQGGSYFMVEKGSYFHTNRDCPKIKGKTITSVTLARVKSLGLKQCPTCVGSYWHTPHGKNYHKDKNCRGMTGALPVTKAAAEKQDQTPCPLCIKNGKGASAGGTLYANPGGKYYHKNKTCGGMKGAKPVTQALIKTRKQKPCPICIGVTSNSSAKYYATKTGRYYHTRSTCGGMKGATAISLVTAKKYNKKACPVCVAKGPTPGAAVGAKKGIYYATNAGRYYHKNATCGGMKGAKKVTKEAAIKNGKRACPVCLSTQANSVYATSGGKYYHKNKTCSGMKHAAKMSLATAKGKGKTACPICYKAQAAKDTYYYATSAGRYYHKNKTCSGMKNATKMSLATAKNKGKRPCPTCLTGAPSGKYYYATKGNRFYHTKSNCSGMTGASKVTLAAAKKGGKTACPVCVKHTSNAKPTPAVKKVYCYASSGSRYYHKNKACSGMKNARKVLLAVAKNKGKTACPVCVSKTVKSTNLTTSFADKKTVCYASGSSAYYHSDKNCVSGLKKTTVAAAKSKRKSACPSCAQRLNTYVYVTRSGTKYHRKSTCAGAVNAYKISLSTALKDNYVRCTKCNAPRK
ncbi:MAG: hypothetical protein RR337_11100 [Clostridia bacterium]